MIAALGLALLAFDFWFFGFLVANGQWLKGLLAAAAVPVVFPIGRGVVIDGANRQIIRWYGWVHKPLIRRSRDFSSFRYVEVAKKLGIEGSGNTGRTVRRPLSLIGMDGRRVLLMTCTWVDGARALAAETAEIMAIPMTDLFPNEEDYEG